MTSPWQPREWLARALDGLTYVRNLPGVTEPAVLGYWPAAPTNPYQRLIYGDLVPRGIVPVALDSQASIPALSHLRALGAQTIFHLHWTNKISALTQSPETAERNSTLFLEAMDDLRAGGTSIVWTVHNIVPHGCLDLEREFALQAGIAERSDVIHLLGPRTLEIVSRNVPLPPERTRVIHHPSYRSTYPLRSDRHATRGLLGIAPQRPTFATVGFLRRNKGVFELLEAFDDLRTVADHEERPVLIIAGDPVDEETTDLLRERGQRDPDVKVFLGKLTDEELIAVVDACDVVVLPYREILNSGVLFLAWGRNKPVVAPALGEVAGLVGPDTGVLFEPDEEASLGRSLAQAVGLIGRADVAPAIEETLQAHDPNSIAASFADLIEELILANRHTHTHMERHDR